MDNTLLIPRSTYVTMPSLVSSALLSQPLSQPVTGLSLKNQSVLSQLSTISWLIQPYGQNYIGPDAGGIYVIDTSSYGNNLVGNGNDNVMIGLWGNDSLYGNAGNDILDGYGHGTNGNGNEEYDVLTGDYWFSEPGIQGVSDGADTFVLGSASEVYYVGTSLHNGGHALVTDFNAGEGDRIQLHNTGNPADYTLSQGSSVTGNAALDTQIFYQGNLIGILQDTTSFSLVTDVNYV